MTVPDNEIHNSCYLQPRFWMLMVTIFSILLPLSLVMADHGNEILILVTFILSYGYSWSRFFNLVTFTIQLVLLFKGGFQWVDSACYCLTF
jgi:hypothetical protein